MGDLSGHDEFVVAAFALSCKGGEYNFLVAQPDELKERSTATFFSKKEMALVKSISGKRPFAANLKHATPYGLYGCCRTLT